MRFRVLGQVGADADGVPVEIRRPRQWGVLGFLLVNRNASVPTDRIVTAIWAEDAPSTARNQIQTDVSAIRRAIVATGSADPIATTLAGYRLAVGPGELDLDEFNSWTARAQTAPDLESAARAWRSALAVWRGDALTGITAAYARAQRVHLAEQRLSAYEHMFDVELELGRHAGIVNELFEIVEQHPLRERLVRQLMLALYRVGRDADALTQARRLRGELADQHGLDPGAAVAELEQRILRRDPTLDVADRSGPSQPVGASYGSVGASHGPVGASRGPMPPRQLPRRTHGVAGRRAELAELDAVLGTGGPDRGFVVAVLTGSPGVGKTTIAVHWAHRVADRFPDGQLYVNLRGFDAERGPVGVAEVLRGFLTALGAASNALPHDADALAVAFRSRVAGRRMLLLLDNARDATQIRPLLPGDAGCLVLVTSRSQLPGLVATEGARVVAVDVFTDAEAGELLALRLGDDRIVAEPDAVADIITACARLPLAVAIAAAKAVARPKLPLKMLADELSDARTTLDALAVGDVDDIDLRAVFSSSYAALSTEAATLFRAIGLPLVAEVTVVAAASLTASSPEVARASLVELVRAQLMVEAGPQRYDMHELLRAYAGELGRGADAAPPLRSATRRLLDHYLHSAWCAAELIQPYRRKPFPLLDAEPGVTLTPLTTRAEALAWLRDELDALAAVVSHASALGHAEHAWQLVWCVHEFLYRQGYWSYWARLAELGVAAAQQTRDRMAMSIAHRCLGRALTQLGRYDEGEAVLTTALGLSPDVVSEATTLQILSELHSRRGRHRDAITALLRALPVNEAHGSPASVAATLNNLGWEHVQLGEFGPTFAYCARSLALFEGVGDKHGQAAVHDTIGLAHHRGGDSPAAAHHYGRSLALRREVGDRYAESTTLRRLGEVYLSSGDRASAVGVWRLAWDILEPINHPDLVELRERLAAWG